MLETFLEFAGSEIANNTRVAAYSAGAGDVWMKPGCFCESLPEVLGDGDYVSPAADPAPWYDPHDPRSARFAGLWVESVEGLLDSTIQRTVTQRVGDGATISCARASNRTLTVTGWLWAADECGADYGMMWLRSALLGSRCAGCNGDDLCLLACCPDDLNNGEGEDSDDPDVEAQWRTLKNAALISGPDVIQRASAGRGCERGARPIYRVQFQISTDPYLWRRPEPVLLESSWPAPTGNEVCNITWNTDPLCDPDNPDCLPGANAPMPGCVADELCPPPPPPPRVPAATANCVCLPLTVVRQCFDIPADMVPSWLDAALRIEVSSGNAPLRNLSIRVWENPLGRTPEELDDCATLGVYYVTYVPANSTLTIDGVTESSEMHCPGFARTDAATTVYGAGAGPLEHITLSCGVTHTICADVDTNYIDPDATLSVSLIAREL
ncbi:hypothetical protein PIS_006 [Saccharomonospora phage PIS 136]|nr:hypothetical protein PIS_006 [Saccharomonospora phage PIS 136]